MKAKLKNERERTTLRAPINECRDGSCIVAETYKLWRVLTALHCILHVIGRHTCTFRTQHGSHSAIVKSMSRFY